MNDPAKIIRIFESMESEDENEATSTTTKAKEEKHDVDTGEVQKLIDGVEGFEKDIERTTFARLWREFRKRSTWSADCFIANRSKARVECVGLVILDDDYYSPSLMCALVCWAFENQIGLIVESAQEKLIEFRHLLMKAGWPPELLSVVSHLKNSHQIKRLKMVIYVGNRIEASSLFKGHWNKIFYTVCLNNTAALLLESCDVHSAVDKIIKCTWGRDSDALWAVSTIVVQESIYDKFVEACEFQLGKLTPDNATFRMNSTHSHVDRLLADKAKLAGARILERNNWPKNLWTPRFLLNYHGEKLETFGRVIKVTTCRTAKEGITLLNNDPTFVSVSVWTDICSQAHEVASMSVSTHLCINSHGIMRAHDPIYLSNLLLNCQMENMWFDKSFLDGPEWCPKVRNVSASAVRKSIDMVAATEKAFQSWKTREDKLFHLMNIVEELETVEREISGIVQMGLDHSEEAFTTYSSSCHVIRERVPIGVVVIYTDVLKNTFAGLAKFLLSGNGIILVGRNVKEFKGIFDAFAKHLPKKLLQVVEKNDEMVYPLVSNPNVKEFIVFGGDEFLREAYLDLKTCDTSMDKSYRFFHTSNTSYDFIRSYKLRVVYVSKIDGFPL